MLLTCIYFVNKCFLKFTYMFCICLERGRLDVCKYSLCMVLAKQLKYNFLAPVKHQRHLPSLL